jgi:hypothetical protein
MRSQFFLTIIIVILCAVAGCTNQIPQSENKRTIANVSITTVILNSKISDYEFDPSTNISDISAQSENFNATNGIYIHFSFKNENGDYIDIKNADLPLKIEILSNGQILYSNRTVLKNTNDEIKIPISSLNNSQATSSYNECVAGMPKISGISGLPQKCGIYKITPIKIIVSIDPSEGKKFYLIDENSISDIQTYKKAS